MSEYAIPQPDKVAAKLAMVADRRNLDLNEQFEKLPRLREFLWFAEWWRRQPGGMNALAERIVRQVGDAILGREFQTLPVDHLGRFSADAVFGVWTRLPQWLRPLAPEEIRAALDCAELAGLVDAENAKKAGISGQTIERIRHWLTRQRCLEECARECTDRLYQTITDFFFDDLPLPEYLSSGPCRGGRKSSLARRAERARALLAGDVGPAAVGSSEAPKPFTVLADLPAVLVNYLDTHARRERQRIVDTEVSKQVFDALEYAFDKRSLVIITGRARYGKTDSVTAWTNAYPGKARLVRTPSSGGEKMLLLRIAEAMGFSCDYDMPVARLREKVCFVLRHGGLGLVFDESHFLIPTSLTRTTTPVRLNFVRTEIVDAGVGCVLAATPQAHENSLESFVRKTRYTVEQFLGRVDWICQLPTELTYDDMLRVARFHLPGLSEGALQLIATRGMRTDQFLHAVKAIGNRACWMAARAGRTEPTPDEIRCASREFVSGICVEIAALVPEPSAKEPAHLQVRIPAERGERASQEDGEDFPSPVTMPEVRRLELEPNH